MAIPQIYDYSIPQRADYPINKTGWRIESSQAVLLIHDMQRYFLQFYDDNSPLVANLIRNLIRLRSWAYENDVPVIYTLQPHEQSATDRALLNDLWGPGLTDADPLQQPVVDELTPANTDTLLTKWRYSAFQRTDLLKHMKDWKRNQIIIGGIYAHIGCMVTAIDAFMNDIQPFMVGDAVADFSEEDHRMALKYVATRCGHIIDTASLVEKSTLITTSEWLKKRVLQLVEDDTELDIEENLIFYGLDSLQVMKISADLKERGIIVSFEDLAREPTLASWLNLVERKSRLPDNENK